MTRRLALLLVVPVLLLVGCTPTAPTASSTQTPVSTSAPVATATAGPVVTPTPTPTPSSAAVVKSAYLIDGDPGHPDANGEWFGEYAFYTDATKTVWCEITIFSADNPAAYCSIVPTAKSQVTYQLPSWANGACHGLDSGLERDGYSLGLAIEPLAPKAAGWAGCSNSGYISAKYLAKTQVLPDGGVLTVHAFTCSVASGVATCSVKDSATETGTIVLGLHTASFTTS